MNDSERELWVNNDEGLYRMWLASHLSMRAFIRRHRAEIDEVMGAVGSGKRQPGYLIYG